MHHISILSTALLRICVRDFEQTVMHHFPMRALSSAALSLPQFWWLLGDADKQQYQYLRTYFLNDTESCQRNRRISTFADHIQLIKSYCVRNDGSDNIRGIVCGILWLEDNGIAINTRQLGCLMSKCKSSINGSFQILGYKETMARRSASDLVAKSLSVIRDNRNELRKWTVRYLVPPERDSEQTVSAVTKADDYSREDAILEGALAGKLEGAQEHSVSNYDIWDCDFIQGEEPLFF